MNKWNDIMRNKMHSEIERKKTFTKKIKSYWLKMFLAIVPHYYMSCFLPKNADHLKKKNNKNAQKSSKKKIDIT